MYTHLICLNAIHPSLSVTGGDKMLGDGGISTDPGSPLIFKDLNVVGFLSL